MGVAGADGEVPGASTIISEDAHPARTLSIASASARSMVSPYSRRTCMVRATYQHWFSLGSHSAASLATFWCRLTLGDASVRFRRPDANSARVAGFAAQRPLSWASERAMMCSMSVSRMLSNHVPSVGTVDAAEFLDDAWFN